MTETTLTAAPARTTLQVRACVLREPGRPPAVETVPLDRPRAGEVLVRIAAAGVCHSDLHLADGQLGDGRWPIVLGHEGAGVVTRVGEGVDRSCARATTSCFCHGRPRAACARPAGSGAARCASRPAPRGSRATCRTGSSGACATPTAARSSTASRVACFAEYAVVVRRQRDPDSRATSRCGRRRCWAAGSSPASARSAMPPASGSASASAVIGCGGVGLQVIAAARLAGAADDHRRRPARRRSSSTRCAAAPPTPSTRRAGDAAAEIIALTGGGVDHAFEVVGAAADDPAGLGCTAARAAPPSWSGSRPVGRRGVACRRSSSSPRSAIVGSYYGSADPAQSLPGLVELVRCRPPGARRHGLAPHRARRRRRCAGPPAPRRGRPLRHRHRPESLAAGSERAAQGGRT